MQFRQPGPNTAKAWMGAWGGRYAVLGAWGLPDPLQASPPPCPPLTPVLSLHHPSGRTHQIRVHGQALGHPVLGDKLYGQTDEAFLALSRGEREPVFAPYGRVPRHLLHAAQIRLSS